MGNCIPICPLSNPRDAPFSFPFIAPFCRPWHLVLNGAEFLQSFGSRQGQCWLSAFHTSAPHDHRMPRVVLPASLLSPASPVKPPLCNPGWTHHHSSLSIASSRSIQAMSRARTLRCPPLLSSIPLAQRHTPNFELPETPSQWASVVPTTMQHASAWSFSMFGAIWRTRKHRPQKVGQRPGYIQHTSGTTGVPPAIMRNLGVHGCGFMPGSQKFFRCVSVTTPRI